jgi:hypothetical protein
MCGEEEQSGWGLARLFHTPRAVKRFVNTYRLIRVSIPEVEMSEFIGTETTPGRYRVAQVLLATVCGYPNVASLFLTLMLKQSGAADGHAVTWSESSRRVHQCESQVRRWRPDEHDTNGPRPSARAGQKAAWGSRRLPDSTRTPEERRLWLYGRSCAACCRGSLRGVERGHGIVDRRAREWPTPDECGEALRLAHERVQLGSHAVLRVEEVATHGVARPEDLDSSHVAAVEIPAERHDRGRPAGQRRQRLGAVDVPGHVLRVGSVRCDNAFLAQRQLGRLR